MLTRWHNVILSLVAGMLVVGIGLAMTSLLASRSQDNPSAALAPNAHIPTPTLPTYDLLTAMSPTLPAIRANDPLSVTRPIILTVPTITPDPSGLTPTSLPRAILSVTPWTTPFPFEKTTPKPEELARLITTYDASRSTPKPSDPYGLIIEAVSVVPPIKQQADYVTVIVSGTVKQLLPPRWSTVDDTRPANPHARDNKAYIYTPVLIEVDQYLKGPQPQSELLLAAFGGQIGQDSVRDGSNQSVYQPGERVILFLRPRNDALNGRQLWGDPYRYTITLDGQAVQMYHRLPLQQLLSEIRAAVSP